MLAGAAVKAVDAAVDGEEGCLPQAAASWALVLMAAAAALHPSLAASLAAGAWVVGMLTPAGSHGTWRDRLEAVLVGLAAAGLVGPGRFLASCLLVAAVQAVDDLADSPPALRAGPVALPPAHLLLGAAALLAVAFWLHPLGLAVVLSATPVAEAVGRWLAGRPGLLTGPPGAEGDGPRWAP